MGLLDAAINFGARAIQPGDKAAQDQGAAKAAQPQNTSAAEAQDKLAQEQVFLEKQAAQRNKGFDLPIKDYKTTVATDADFVKDTLRTKLSELNLSPDTKVSVRKGALGDLELSGKIPEEKRERMESDLNNSRAFKAAFNRLSVNQPTLDYLDNVSKLSQAYGTRNNLFDSLLSENNGNNQLQDIAHRYDEMRRHVAEAEEMAAGQSAGYEIRVNVSA